MQPRQVEDLAGVDEVAKRAGEGVDEARKRAGEGAKQASKGVDEIKKRAVEGAKQAGEGADEVKKRAVEGGDDFLQRASNFFECQGEKARTGTTSPSEWVSILGLI
jgi:hypothetical protein